MIDKCKKYKFIYVSVSFENNSNFLTFLQKGFEGIEIPYLDVKELTPDAKDSLDSYIYMEDNEEFSQRFKTLTKKFPKISFTVLGSVWGRGIYKFFNVCKQEIIQSILPGSYYKIIDGEFKNLVVRVDEVLGDKARVSVKFLTERKDFITDLSNLKKSEYGDLNEEYKNLWEKFQFAGVYRALIIDFSDALLRAVLTHQNKYTNSGFFVGGVLGVYFTFLRLRQMYPEYTFFVVFNPVEEINNMGFNPKLDKVREFYESLRETIIWAEDFARNLGFHVVKEDSMLKKQVFNSLVSILCRERFEKILIYSSNTEFHPLVDGRISILIPKETHRGHSKYITLKEILNIWEVNSSEKIIWLRCIQGDSKYPEVIGVNVFNRQDKGLAHPIKLMDFLQVLNSSNTLEEFVARISQNPKFTSFMKEQFHKNLKILDFGEKKELDLARYVGKYDDNNLQALLKKYSLFKECEQWERNSRIFRSLW